METEALHRILADQACGPDFLELHDRFRRDTPIGIDLVHDFMIDCEIRELILHVMEHAAEPALRHDRLDMRHHRDSLPIRNRNRVGKPGLVMGSDSRRRSRIAKNLIRDGRNADQSRKNKQRDSNRQHSKERPPLTTQQILKYQRRVLHDGYLYEMDVAMEISFLPLLLNCLS